MWRKILLVFIAILSFILFNLGWHIYEKNRISHIYDLLEVNIKVTDEERIPAETINKVLESGIDSSSAADFKKEFVQIINNRLHTDITSDQLTITGYDTNLNINFQLNNNISYVYRYFPNNYIMKIASIEKDNRIYMSRSDNYSSERSLDYDESLLGFGFWLIIYSSAGALIFIILGILFFKQIQYKDVTTGELVDISKLGKVKGRLFNIVIFLVLSLLTALIITFINNKYNPYHIANKTYQILDKNLMIHNEEHLPVELINNTINDYQVQINKQENDGASLQFRFYEGKLASYDFEKVELPISDNLRELIEQFITGENSVTGYELDRDDIEILFHEDSITIYYHKLKYHYDEYYTFFYLNSGHIAKDLELNPYGGEISYKSENFNNWQFKFKKNTRPEDYRQLSMMICSWICALICFAFNRFISERLKNNISVWDNEQNKFIQLDGYYYFSYNVPLKSYGIILFIIGILSYIPIIGSTAILCLIGSVAAFAFFRFFRKSKRKLILVISILIILPVVILTVNWIQREIRWVITRHEMDILESDMLQKIDISDNEILPKKMLEELHTAIMNNESENLAQALPEFEALTGEFLQRINKQMNLDLQPKDLSGRCAEKDNLEGTGDRVIASYQFAIGDVEYFYHYQIDRTTKMLLGKLKDVYRISISNDNNETIYASYKTWKNDPASLEVVSKSDYDAFMKSWKIDALPYKYLTIKNIRKYVGWN